MRIITGAPVFFDKSAGIDIDTAPPPLLPNPPSQYSLMSTMLDASMPSQFASGSTVEIDDVERPQGADRFEFLAKVLHDNPWNGLGTQNPDVDVGATIRRSERLGSEEKELIAVEIEKLSHGLADSFRRDRKSVV